MFWNDESENASSESCSHFERDTPQSIRRFFPRAPSFLRCQFGGGSSLQKSDKSRQTRERLPIIIYCEKVATAWANH